MFTTLASTAEAIKNLLVSKGIFQRVDLAAVSTGEQLLHRIQSLDPLPAAVVCVGAGDFGQLGRTRETTIAVIVAAKPDALDVGAKAIWKLVDDTIAVFAPTIDDDAETWVELDGVRIEPASWEPVDAPNLRAPTFALILNAKDHQ
jgi:hypothetical protein